MLAGVLFVAGFVARLVGEAAGGDSGLTAAMYAVTIQAWAYGAGLLVLAALVISSSHH